jgi:hypothetical protein
VRCACGHSMRNQLIVTSSPVLNACPTPHASLAHSSHSSMPLPIPDSRYASNMFSPSRWAVFHRYVELCATPRRARGCKSLYTAPTPLLKQRADEWSDVRASHNRSINNFWLLYTPNLPPWRARLRYAVCHPGTMSTRGRLSMANHSGALVGCRKSTRRLTTMPTRTVTSVRLLRSLVLLRCIAPPLAT